jgi:hypothetical protein
MTTHTPLRCANSAMAADPTASAGKQVVLMDTGNYPSFSSFLNETWEFTGTDWSDTSSTLVDANGPLPGRTNFVMCFDGVNVMLYGGKGGSSTTGILEDTWVWGTVSQTWTKLTPATVPSGRYGAADGYISTDGVSAFTGGVVMFGGQNPLYNLLETWLWDGTAQTWTQVVVANGKGPAARVGHVMAGSGSIAGTPSVVMFGGEGTNSQFNDTWQFTMAAGGTWTQLSPATSPSVRSGACMAYDSTNSLWVMFGGKNEYTDLVETWTFDGTTWSQVAVTNGKGPAGRTGAQMAFDPVSATTIMYGGISASVNYPSNETWSFNGSTLAWTQL